MKIIGFLPIPSVLMPLVFLLSMFLVLSCATGSSETGQVLSEPLTPIEGTAPEAALAAQPVFDPHYVTPEMFEYIMAELRVLIEELNTIIRARDYAAWVTYLSDSYYEEINSEEFLTRVTEDLFRRDQIIASVQGRNLRQVQRRELLNSRDFFYNVVVPARSNDRLDDIDFVAQNHVMAITVDHQGRRLVLYNLMLINNRWMIIN